MSGHHLELDSRRTIKLHTVHYYIVIAKYIPGKKTRHSQTHYVVVVNSIFIVY